MSNAFAEEPQFSDQEIVKAWGQAQTEVQEMVPATTKGKQLLTDENLDEITAAGAWGLLTNTQGSSVLAWSKTYNIGKAQITKCFGIICNVSAQGK